MSHREEYPDCYDGHGRLLFDPAASEQDHWMVHCMDHLKTYRVGVHDAGGSSLTCGEICDLINRLQKENAELREAREHFEKFVGFAATCRRNNTREWMRLMEDWLNGAAARLDPETHFVAVVGVDYFEVSKQWH